MALYFTRVSWIAANEPVCAFGHNGNGRIDFGDLAGPFDRL